MRGSKRQDFTSRPAPPGHDILSRRAHPMFDASDVYRDAHAHYARAFRIGDVRAIEEAFSRMQDLGRAFRDGVAWAERILVARQPR